MHKMTLKWLIRKRLEQIYSLCNATKRGEETKQMLKQRSIF